ncbi:unnamed protein product [Knipowitschia caucasica]
MDLMTLLVLSWTRLTSDTSEQCAPALCGPSVIVSTLQQQLPLPGIHLKRLGGSPHPSIATDCDSQ